MADLPRSLKFECLLKRKSPKLAMKFDGLMAETRSRSQLAGSQAQLAANSIDKGRLAETFDCAFGKKQIAAKTRTGRLLQLRAD